MKKIIVPADDIVISKENVRDLEIALNRWQNELEINRLHRKGRDFEILSFHLSRIFFYDTKYNECHLMQEQYILGPLK